jgi:hypothetical protein
MLAVATSIEITMSRFQNNALAPSCPSICADDCRDCPLPIEDRGW